MNKEQFIIEINNLGIKYTAEQLKLLDIYYKELVDYNKHTNLTRILDEEDVYLKHFYDSLTLAKIIDLTLYNNLLDIGSGAGFPGIVLKIFYPNLNITLLDSNNKKTKFLNYIKEKLNLEIEVINDRTENYALKNCNKFEIVTARAVANLRVLTEISTPFVDKDCHFIAMKGQIKEEINETISTIEKMKLKIVDTINFDLPNEGGERTLIKIKKLEKTNFKNLRRYENILKNSL